MVRKGDSISGEQCARYTRASPRTAADGLQPSPSPDLVMTLAARFQLGSIKMAAAFGWGWDAVAVLQQPLLAQGRLPCFPNFPLWVGEGWGTCLSRTVEIS